LDDGTAIACPSCGAEILAESDSDPAPARPAALPERRSDPIEIAHARAESDEEPTPGSSVLPPAPKKSVSIDLSGLAVRDANRKAFELPRQEESSAPKLEHLEKVARTSDEEFAAVDDEPRQRVTSKRVQEEIMGWDDDESTKRTASQSTVTSTFKLVLFALPVLIGVVIFALNVRPKQATRPAINAAAAAAAAEAAMHAKPPKPPDPTSPSELRKQLGDDAFLELLRDTAKNFFATSTIDERQAFVRHRDRVRPLMENYYAKHELNPVAVDKIAPRDRYHIERGFVITGVTFPEDDALPIVFSREGDSLLVDWESFVGYGEMDLDEFVTQGPTEPVLMRLRAKPDDYFNNQFDEKNYHCLSLSDLKFSQRLYGYIRKGSPTAEKLFTQMAKENGIDFVILKVRFPPNAPPPTNANAPKQVIVHEFIDIGWLMKEEQAE
jgi:hypothetical protein